MSELVIKPSQEAIREAKLHPNGWVYQIDARYNCKGQIHGQGISNSLKSVDFREEGSIQRTTDHLAAKAVVYGMTLQERHREAS
jgi:hypothetical protein